MTTPRGGSPRRPRRLGPARSRRSRSTSILISHALLPLTQWPLCGEQIAEGTASIGHLRSLTTAATTACKRRRVCLRKLTSASLRLHCDPGQHFDAQSTEVRSVRMQTINIQTNQSMRLSSKNLCHSSMTSCTQSSAAIVRLGSSILSRHRGCNGSLLGALVTAVAERRRAA